MSIFLVPSIERNFCFLLDKSKTNDTYYNDDESRDQERIKIWVSKELLAVASPVFKIMLYGEFREANSEEPIYLPGKTEEDFLKFLDCLFPHSMQSDVNESNVEAILRLSDEYQVESLTKKCNQFYERVVKGLNFGDKAVLTYLPIFFKYKFKDLIKLCVPYVASVDLQDLEQFRLQKNQAMVGYEHFYFTIYEAKLRRTLKEQHEWYSNSSNRHMCQKCGCTPTQVQLQKCIVFHTCAKDGSPCTCGYDFDADCLNL